MRVGKNCNSGTIIMVLLLGCAGAANAKTLYVAAGADLGGNGSSWAAAYRYLQDALHDPAVEYGDEIWVAAGTYKPDEDESGNVAAGARTASFALISGVALYGGFPPAGGDWPDRDPNTYETILSGDLAENDEPVDNPADLLDDPNRAENSYHVVVARYTDPNNVLDGFTISRGNANHGSNPNYFFGGGIYGYYNVRISNCTISGNSARYNGGLSGGYGSISSCLISGNAASGGGGLGYCHGPIINCTISGNSAVRYGGGGICECDGPITNCKISGNSAEDKGGGIYACSGPITNCTISSNSATGTGPFVGGGGLGYCDGPITNCTISGNLTDRHGGGLCYCDGPITNCTICGNSAEYYGGGLSYCRGSISNCIIWDNVATSLSYLYYCSIPIYSFIQGGSDGIGCISADPNFVKPGYWHDNGTPDVEIDDFWIEGDYHLSPDSPCIDAGNFCYNMNLPSADLDGYTRLAGPQIDIGCYEYGSTTDSDGDWLADNLEPDHSDNPDRDADGIVDGVELLRGTDPNRFDPLDRLHIPGDATSIQEALFFSRSGETITVETETYFENLFIGGRNIVLTGTDPNDPNVVAATLINADVDGNPATANGRVVTFAGTENENCQLRGLTITGGNVGVYGGGIYGNQCQANITNCSISANTAYEYGGGLYLYNGSITNCNISGNSVTGTGYNKGGGGFSYCDGAIANCTISGNSAEFYGGGLFYCNGSITNCKISGNSAMNGGGFYGCDGPITNCTISNNSGRSGGGMYYCDGTIFNSTVKGNSAYWDGGGLYGCDGLIMYCTISGNYAHMDGGGLNDCSAPIDSSCIVLNRANLAGGGIFCYGRNELTLINCTVAGNMADQGNSIVCDSYHQSYPSTIELENCILWNGGDEIWNNDGSTITITYSDIQGGWQGTGNIDVDPNFVAIGYWDDNDTPANPDDDFWVDGDYHLQSQAGRWDVNSQTWVYDAITSRCIDAGNPGMAIGDEYPDPENVRINMGAYGGTAEASRSPAAWSLAPDVNNDGIVEITDYTMVTGCFGQTGENLPGDFNHDGVVDLLDLATLAAHWLEETIWYAQ